MPDALIIPYVSESFEGNPVAVSALPLRKTAFDVHINPAGDFAQCIRVYEKQKTQWVLRGDGTQSHSISTGSAGVAVVPGKTGLTFLRDFRITLTTATGETVSELDAQVAPVLLASSLEPVETVFVVSSSVSASFVDALKQLLPLCYGKPKLVPIEPVAIAHDLWMQDTTEIGICTVPQGRNVVQIPVPFGGLRSNHDDIETERLDQTMREYFSKEPQYVPMPLGKPREGVRWIDWFGNLEVSPPVPGYPFGRVLTGRQKELSMHPGVIAFLEAQRLQCPPLYLDVSWLTIGHVDELINFVPARDGKGFRALLPSPRFATQILAKADKEGFGTTPVFAGTHNETTVKRLLEEVGYSDESKTIEESLRDTRKLLASELKLTESDIVALPVLFRNGLAVIPNSVNSLIIGPDALIPAPRGPQVNGADIFESAIRSRLQPLGVRPHFMDIYQSYHVRSGEIHCGTNAVRRLRNPRWWKEK